LRPDWAKLFPDVSLPSLEFVNAWEQVNIPAGASPLAIIEDRVMNEPLTLLDTPVCEGYEHYLGIAFHLQRLTPRRDILLPVEPLSGLLTKLMGKDVSPQSVSQYCRRAKQDGYITLTAKAHHPSGKAARYQFDLKRFTETGIELDPMGAKGQLADTDFSHGTHGTHGIHGSDGIHGIHGIDGRKGTNDSSSCVLKHIKATGQKQSSKCNQGMSIKDKIVKEELVHATPPFVKMTKIKKKIKRQSIVALWQSEMYARFGWQEKLPANEYEMLVKYGQKTDEFGFLILRWAMNNWELFASEVVSKDTDSYPALPDVTFFDAFQAQACFMWTARTDTDDEELNNAFATANKDLYDICCSYMYPADLFPSCANTFTWSAVEKPLKYLGKLVRKAEGQWTVCGKVFHTYPAVEKEYINNAEFRKLVAEALE
jgi:hypothetical protein